LVLSDRVGAAHDLLVNGENGFLVTAGDVDAAAAALRKLATTATSGWPRAPSRELARDWGYGPSVDGFLAAVGKRLRTWSDVPERCAHGSSS
jgi:glycosyltransferase involved in cell wall biosynthesis